MAYCIRPPLPSASPPPLLPVIGCLLVIKCWQSKHYTALSLWKLLGHWRGNWCIRMSVWLSSNGKSAVKLCSRPTKAQVLGLNCALRLTDGVCRVLCLFRKAGFRSVLALVLLTHTNHYCCRISLFLKAYWEGLQTVVQMEWYCIWEVMWKCWKKYYHNQGNTFVQEEQEPGIIPGWKGKLHILCIFVHSFFSG